MGGLFYKDFCMLKKQLGIYALLLGLYGVMSYFTKNTAFFNGMAFAFSSMIAMNSIAADTATNFDGFILATPIPRWAVIVSKYALSFIFFLINALIGITLMLTTGAGISETVVTWGIMLIFYACVTSISFPLIYKMGIDKARFIIMAVYGLPVIALVGASTLMKGSLTAFAEKFLGNLGLLWYAPYLLVALTLITLVVSCRGTISIYRNKQF